MDGQNPNDPPVRGAASEFVIACQDERDGNKEIYVRGLSGPERSKRRYPLTNDVQRSERPSLIWTGTQLAVVAGRTRRDKEIYLPRP